MSTLYVAPESLLESRTFRRMLAFSLVGHVVIFAALTFRPFRSHTLISPSPVMVNVVDMPKPAAPPPTAKKAAPKPPAPKPEVKPPPPPPKPVVNEVVIPKDPAPLAKPKPTPKPVAKPEPKPKSAEEILAELTKKVEAENPEPEPVAKAPVTTPGPAAPIAGGPGTFDPLLSPWVARVRTVIHGNWTGAQLCKGAPSFDVVIEASGQLTDIELAESSGDRYCDESAERAIRKSNPLPAPPRGAMSVTLKLSPKDVL